MASYSVTVILFCVYVCVRACACVCVCACMHVCAIGVSVSDGGVCVSSVADGSILIPTDASQSIVGATSDGVIGLFLQTSDVRKKEKGCLHFGGV